LHQHVEADLNTADFLGGRFCSDVCHHNLHLRD
jgi:hypothetical protein